MEAKNKRLWELLTTMGVTVLGTQTGAVTIVENKNVEHKLTHERINLQQQSK